MDKLRKIIGNTLISLFGQLVTWTSTFMLTIAYGRFLGDLKFGELYFALTFVSLIGFPLDQGFNQQLTREVAQVPEKAIRYLSNTLFLKFGLWVILYSLILFLSWILGQTQEVRTLVFICGLSLLTSAIATTFASAHYAFERTVFPVVGTILEKGLSALVGFTALRMGASVEVMALILLGGSMISGIWQAIWFFRHLGFHFIYDFSTIRDLVKTSLPFLAYGAMGVLYYRLDTILLSFMTSNAVVGWYGAGYRLFDTMVFLPSLVIVAIMYPVFSKYSVTSEESLKIAVEKSMNFLLFCVLPIATVMIVAAPNIIGFLYHEEEFSNSIPVLQGLAPGLIFLYMNTIHSSVIVSSKRENRTTIMAAIALVFNLSLNLLLIPLYKQVGAAMITSLTEMLLFGLSLIFMPRNLIPVKSLFVAAKALVASAIMGVAIWFLREFNLVVILGLGMVVYLVVATVLGTIPREDIMALYTSIRRKGQRAATSPEAQEKLQELLEEEMDFIQALDYVEMDTLPLRAVMNVIRQTGQYRAVQPPTAPDYERFVDADTLVHEALADALAETVKRPAPQMRKLPRARPDPQFRKVAFIENDLRTPDSVRTIPVTPDSFPTVPVTPLEPQYEDIEAANQDRK